MGTRIANCIGPDGAGCLAPHDCGGQPECPGYPLGGQECVCDPEAYDFGPEGQKRYFPDIYCPLHGVFRRRRPEEDELAVRRAKRNAA
jgi:hypothetical protein